MAQVLLLFVDGVGVGIDDAMVNPFVNAGLGTLHALADTRQLTVDSVPCHTAGASVIGLDAVMGVDGVPQSGTGQTALLTGVNAAELHGRHFGPWVPARLRTLVRDESVLARASNAGFRVAFANAYPEEAMELAGEPAAALPSDAPARGARVRRTPSFLRAGPPLAAIGSGLLTRHTMELERGDAVASEITNEGWRERLGRKGVPVISAEQAGRNLALLAARYDLTMFAHYSTDYAGHQQDMDAAIAALEKFDAFLAGLLDEADDDLVIFIVSDHGNIEDVRMGHTRNAALAIVTGTGHARLADRLRSLTDVTPAILHALTLRRS